jgi:hypothetical protein
MRREPHLDAAPETILQLSRVFFVPELLAKEEVVGR